MKTQDPYMDRVRIQTDPVLRKAQESILMAARAVFDATLQLHCASRTLERHPDFIKTERARRKAGTVVPSLTPAWWLHNSIKGALEDASIEDAGDWLLEDSNPRRLTASLRCFVETDKRDRAEFARRQRQRRPASRKASPLVAVSEPAAA